MLIKVNGEARSVEPDTLSAVLDALGYGEAIVATALNGEFVPVEARTETRLRDGDRLEILAPMQGG
ncbi:sulfur carrier protein ThiS [Stappia taiwanensis]|uniref:Sulfur carrier protein ThiS n=1 Tax=Stappia taiwanensis TaxID=992267 RepID=A0A838XW55_9HYPH|nr:sulfur carrier protein ThiS [Stappia taiwanensis]MBA4612726.1 sulfur carrier protein ThiS [Stappia taiwanensis]GGE90527.1 thiamine biosynthesis protein ThiS [Stappia taiwanensis]